MNKMIVMLDNFIKKAAIYIIKKDPFFIVTPKSHFDNLSYKANQYNSTIRELDKHKKVLKTINLFIQSVNFDLLEYGINPKDYNKHYIVIKRKDSGTLMLIDVETFNESIDLTNINRYNTNIIAEASISRDYDDTYELVSIDSYLPRKGYGTIIFNNIIKIVKQKSGVLLYGDIWGGNNEDGKLTAFYNYNKCNIRNGKFYYNINK
ncbi:hypothetical protein BHU72_01935 [Desulfuribacillus stibiiarsenatis]|uniref:Uncharacterized protein n=1 Tax=Desulfuribacillus stibiiarsenatis TaxID=1390249 RepID=A0A1E5L6I5_9FIRM|nr:hypothetical protein [Desulfuribacillus stibiiarsenatis]OEH85583.1 hypothetical protein BHU72_01935 [Desulfuribacillus stibiiarsenatis]